MPRLKNTTSGVVVNVDEAFAARLGSGWKSADADEKAPAKRSARKTSAAKSDADSE